MFDEIIETHIASDGTVEVKNVPMAEAERQMLDAMIPGRAYSLQSAATAASLSVSLAYNALRSLGKQGRLEITHEGELPLWTKG